MQTNLHIGRTGLLILSLAISGWIAFKTTPDLDDVDNRLVYRAAYMLLWMRGLAWFMLDALGLFPLD